MIEPLSSTILTALFEKIIDLLGKEFQEKLLSPKRKKTKALLEIFENFKTIETTLSQLVRVLKKLKRNRKIYSDDDPRLADIEINTSKQLEPLYAQINNCLNRISRYLKKLGPAFEVMAQSAAPLIQAYRSTDGIFLGRLELLRSYLIQRGRHKPVESLDDYLARLEKFIKEGQEARNALAVFIRKTHTWESVVG